MTASTDYRLENISLAELHSTDLRREAAGLWLLNGLPDGATREDIADILAAADTTEPFRQYPALAYRLLVDGRAEGAEVLVDTLGGRVCIAWGADAEWGDLSDPCDLTTVEGGDSYAAALHAAIRDWLDDPHAWEARA